MRSGMPAFSVAVVGNGAAPDVELRGPKGESYTLPASGPRKPDGAIGFRSPVDKTAYFAVARPSGGRWSSVGRASRCLRLPRPLSVGADLAHLLFHG